ncbi:MAG: sulfotransferase family protein [Roseiflexaceae bacterium]
MGQKVFNVGFSKTGTTSFEQASMILGYETYRGNWQLNHSDFMLALWVNRDYTEIRRMTTYWDAYADAPWGGSDLYKHLIEWYPDAKYVHTVRSTNHWYESLYSMLTKFDENPATALASFHASKRYGFVYYFWHEFGIENLVNNKSKICEKYDRHNQEVTEFMKAAGVSYLQMDLENGAGWDVLCPFLGRDVPTQPFPHSNKKPTQESLVNSAKETT